MNIFKNIFTSNPAKKQPKLDIQFIDFLINQKPNEAIRVLKEGANPNAFYDDYLPAIYIACNRDYEDVVKLLINLGADLNAKGSSKKQNIEETSALITSTARGNLKITELLVKNGANINIREKSGITPLMTASYRAHYQVVEYLIENGALLEEKDDFGYTALMYAANSGNLYCAKALIKNSANVEAKDNDDSTPIMFAAQHGFTEIVKLLLKNNADKNHKGKHGLNSIDFAKQNKHIETIEILEENLLGHNNVSYKKP